LTGTTGSTGATTGQPAVTTNANNNRNDGRELGTSEESAHYCATSATTSTGLHGVDGSGCACTSATTGAYTNDDRNRSVGWLGPTGRRERIIECLNVYIESG
jgi:hypothetical protein